MSELMQRSLVLLKPDAVQRGLMGRVISRFEDVGLKVIGAKMLVASEDLASSHYGDLDVRRGVAVKKQVVDMMTKNGPVMALVLEGIEAVEQVRMMVGPTEPKSALPGTIRGDFAHVSFKYADEKSIGIKNLIHASGNAEEAKVEVSLWFTAEELHSYRSVHDAHILE